MRCPTTIKGGALKLTERIKPLCFFRRRQWQNSGIIETKGGTTLKEIEEKEIK